jgi:hypothetical protein
MKYSIPSDKGRCCVCRLCNAKEVYRDGNFTQYNFEIKKFEVIKVIPNFKNAIKRFFYFSYI